MSRKPVRLYTDGACSGNPGPGGWGSLLTSYNAQNELVEKELSGAEPATTNNRMELMAVIQGLEALKSPCAVTIVTDSQYVKNGMEQWIHGWRRNGWKTADKKPVKNVELWQRLWEACQRHDIAWEWVKGHAGHVENERVDQLAREAIKLLRA